MLAWKRFPFSFLKTKQTNSIQIQTQRFEFKIEPQTIKQMQGSMDAQQQNISAKFYKNNPSLFIFTKFSVEKINVGKFLKLWENYFLIFNFNHILKSKNFRVWQISTSVLGSWEALQLLPQCNNVTSIHHHVLDHKMRTNRELFSCLVSSSYYMASHINIESIATLKETRRLKIKEQRANRK